MKNAMVYVKLFVMALGAVLILSCSTEDGEDGATGPQGLAGVDGQDGINGQDGLDGNANILNFTFDISDIDGMDYDVNIPELTTELVENGIFLAYLKSGNSWQQIPGSNILLNDLSTLIDVNSYAFPDGSSENYSFYIEFNQTGASYSISQGDLSTLRIVLLTSTSITEKNLSVFQEMKSSGIDFSNYHAVMDYLNLEY